MTQNYSNPITQDISFRYDGVGIQIHCSIAVTNETVYPLEKMARLAQYIKEDIKDAILVHMGENEDNDDTL